MMPVTQLVTALQQELAQLEAELKADPRYRKATRIRELLADYIGQAQPQTVSAQTSPIRIHRGIGLPRSKKALIKVEVEQLLLSGPTHRKKILEVLESKGLMGHEKDPMASLAAYLTAFSDNFVNNGSGTWSIRESSQAPKREPTPGQVT
jgi:hypothetical protein